MPFVIRKDGDQFCVYTQDAEGKPTGKSHGCHPTHDQAVAQLRALYANVPEARTKEKQASWQVTDYHDQRPGVLLIHHAQTKMDKQGVAQGWLDQDLNKKGEKEAHKFAKEVRDLPITQLHSSDLKRAEHTAKIIGEDNHIPVTGVSKDYRTWNLGDLQGEEHDDHATDLERYVRQEPDKPVPGGESFNTFKNRATNALSDVVSHSGKHGLHAIVTHHRVMELAQANTGGQFNVDRYMAGGIPKSGVIKLIPAPEMTGRKAIQKPPNLRDALNEPEQCVNCKYYEEISREKGTCSLYGDYPVDASDVCDSYIRESQTASRSATKERNMFEKFIEWMTVSKETPAPKGEKPGDKPNDVEPDDDADDVKKARKAYGMARKAYKKAKKARKKAIAGMPTMTAGHGPGGMFSNPATGSVLGFGKKKKKEKKPKGDKPDDDEAGETEPDDEQAEGKEQGGHLVSEEGGEKHLPTMTGGKPDHRLMGAAWAALHGGYRGNKYEGPNKGEAISKLTAMYKREGMPTPDGEQSKTKAVSTDFSVVKQADGHYRWIGTTTSAFRDRDRELITTDAHKADIERMNDENQFGDAGWWHAEFKTNDPQTRDPGVCVPIATCDQSVWLDEAATRIESGVFHDDAVGEAFAAHQKAIGLSLDFWTPATEPDKEGNYHKIHTFRRSFLPSEYASNLMGMGGVAVQKEIKTMDDKLAKFKEIVGDDAFTRIVDAAKAKAKALETAGVERKEVKGKDEKDEKPDDKKARRAEETRAIVKEMAGDFVTKKDLKDMFHEFIQEWSTAHQKEADETKAILKDMQEKVEELYGDAPGFIKKEIHNAMAIKTTKEEQEARVKEAQLGKKGNLTPMGEFNEYVLGKNGN